MKRTILFVKLCALLLTAVSCEKPDVTEQVLSRYIEAKNYYLKGNSDDALRVFLEIREKNPDFLNNTFMIGKIYFLQEDYENAEEAFSCILRSNSYHIDARKYLARILINQFRFDKAEEQISQAMEISSEDPDLIILLADIKKQSEDFASAIELYKKAAIYEIRFAFARIELAEIYRSAGLADKTKAELEKALNMLEKDSMYFKPVNNILEGLKNENQ
jgi:tetratricopeptide (TPR) repeat protein